jgi:D-alanyl-D-alanine carboxypeptidase
LLFSRLIVILIQMKGSKGEFFIMKKLLILLLLLVLFPASLFAAEKSIKPLALKAALLVDMDSGKVLYAQNADRLIQPASLSKILALYLINEDLQQGRIKLSDAITISSRAVKTRGSKMLYEEGAQVSLDDLIKGMAIHSANDCTVAIAEYSAGSVEKFVARMNAKTRELGMKQSYFVNPHGLPDSHQQSTAREIFVLSREYLRHFPDSLSIHSMLSFTYHDTILRNRNDLLRDYPDVDGLKTGYVRAAGFHLVATAKRGDKRLIAVVLGAKNRQVRSKQMRKLLDYGFGQIGEGQPRVLIGA